jgi:GT2 family glycosyltransferase
VALLNPDALAEPRWLERLVAAASASPAAAFASRQMMRGSPGILDGAGDAYHSSGLAWRRRYGAALGAGDLEPREVFSPCAAAALYRAVAWREVGGMDESYFCYFEDVDLGFRMRLAGHSCVYVPDAVVEHVGSATTGGRHSEFAIYHGHRNLVWTFVKDMPGAAFWLLLPLHLALNLVSIAWFALRGRGPALLRAKRDAIAGLPRAWRARRAVQATRRVPIRAIWRILDRGWLVKWVKWELSA